jgi:hypothetical protein
MKTLFTLLSAASLMSAATVFDGTFNNVDWTVSVISSQDIGGVGYTAMQQSPGGNPGQYRDEVHTIQSAGGSYTGMRWFNEYNPLTYNITSNITSIDFSADIIHIGSPIVAYAFAVEQAGTVFLSAAAGTTSSWNTFATNVSASGLCAIGNPNDLLAPLNCSSNPNFNVGGAPLTFGYMVGNSFGTAGATVNYHSGIDNFSVMVNSQVPEPASAAAMGGGLVAVAFLRRYFSQRASQSKSSE